MAGCVRAGRVKVVAMRRMWMIVFGGETDALCETVEGCGTVVWRVLWAHG